MKKLFSIVCFFPTLLILSGTTFAEPRNMDCPKLEGVYAFDRHHGVECTIQASENAKRSGTPLIFPAQSLRFEPKNPFKNKLTIRQNGCKYEFANQYATDNGWSDPRVSLFDIPTSQEWITPVGSKDQVRTISDSRTITVNLKNGNRGYGCWGVLCGGRLDGKSDTHISTDANGNLRVRYEMQETLLVYVIPMVEGYKLECIFPRIQ